jgi:hypothetical protein
MGTISSVSDGVADAVVYLGEARNVTGEVLHMMVCWLSLKWRSDVLR